MAIPTLLPDQHTGLVEVQADGSLELVLPWARSITMDEPTVRVGLDPAIPVAIDEDPVSLPRRAPTEPVTDQPTQALHRLSVMEKLVVMRAVAAVAKLDGCDVAVSAMPWHAPEKVHLQASNWRAFAGWLQSLDFRFVHREVQRALGVMQAARAGVTYTPPRPLPKLAEQTVLDAWDDVVKNLRVLAEAAPQMENRKVGDVLHLPFEAD